MHVVLVETSGNQGYIFASNKLAEAVGASELTYRCGTQWVLEAVRDIGGPDLWEEKPGDLRDALLDPQRNPPIESGSAAVEVVHATSGKALLLVADETQAKEVVRRVTERALREAPGLDVFGMVGPAFDWGLDLVGERISAIHRCHSIRRRHRPQVVERFPRLPPVAGCATTGLPAGAQVRVPDENEAVRSAVAASKIDSELKRLANSRLNHLDDGVPFATDVNDLGELFSGDLGWVAVIHADGNGLGEVFSTLSERLPPDARHDRAVVDAMRRFSLAIDVCTEQAFRAALPTVGAHEGTRPLVPLILGGDDLTVLCAGPPAVRFTVKFLREFERLTSPGGLPGDAPEPLAGIVQELIPEGRVGSSAGVAVVKPHFPFREAYDLAVALTDSAKQVKTKVTQGTSREPCTAIDFHVVFDSSNLDLERIRESLRTDEKDGLLTMRPYVVTPREELVDAGEPWRHARHWADLSKWIQALRAEDETGRRALPNSQVHALREALHQGRGDAYYQLVRDRYRPMSDLGPDGPDSLFTTRGGDARTGLFDAMDVVALEHGRQPAVESEPPAPVTSTVGAS